MGEIRVPADARWGAQTQRSLQYFPMVEEPMPRAVIAALVRVKLAAAKANARLGILAPRPARAIVSAAEEVLTGRLWREFPLSQWQTGSGTQSHMNVNEVLANLANRKLAGGKRASSLGAPVSAHDHVNRSQSSNDVFPTAMNVAACLQLHQELLPSLDEWIAVWESKVKLFRNRIKVGRTHLMDATPLTLGQEFSAFVAQLQSVRSQLREAGEQCLGLAIGGTAVGTGLNSDPRFAALVAKELARQTGLGFHVRTNKFAQLAGHEALLALSAAQRALAVVAFKIANDIRLLASGPRTGLAELILPENEPGSSIMPGKVNPTQCEALSMVALQVIGNDSVVAMAASNGQLQLNVYKPLIIANVLRSGSLLSQSIAGFSRYCLRGLKVNAATLERNLQQSLMLVTALTPQLGYAKSAEIAKYAHEKGLSLQEAALAVVGMSATEFRRLVRAQDMLGPMTQLRSKRKGSGRASTGSMANRRAKEKVRTRGSAP